MQFEVIACVTARVKLKRQRTFKELDFTVPVPVSIREASTADAPVALRYDAPADPEWARKKSLDVKRVELRTTGDGVLFGKARMPDGVADAAKWLVETSRKCSDNERNPFYDPGKLWYNTEGPLSGFDVVETESSSVEQVTAAVQNRAARLLVVDGALWDMTEEPLLHVALNRYDRRIDGVILPRRHIEQQNKLQGWSYPAAELFRLDQLELAEVLMRPLADESDFPLHLPHVEALDRDCLRYDGESLALSGCTPEILERMAKGLETRDLPFMAAYVALRDAFPAYLAALAGGQGLGRDDFAEILQAAVTARYPDDTQNYDTALREAEMALRRHRTERDLGSTDDLSLSF
jgi:hypothetical protein